jgi:IS30 family transposase
MKHITLEQRYEIQSLLKAGYTQKDIAKAIDKSESTISREIKRNKDLRGCGYKATTAQNKYRKRLLEKPKHIRFTEAIKQNVEELLAEDLSPEQVVGLYKKLNKEVVSHETIYQHIWSDKKKGGELYTHLRRRGRKNKKRGSSRAGRGFIPDRIGIEKRPKVVDEKIRFGDLEVDTIIGKDHQGAIVTINSRATGMLKMKKVEKRTAEQVSLAIEELLQDWKPFVETITADNGKEFAMHQRISESLNIDFYFANPYHSWERGANENLNGLIRQYFPKKTDFSTITDAEIQRVEDKLNNRPRKRLNFETPLESMEKLLFNQEIAFMA